MVFEKFMENTYYEESESGGDLMAQQVRLLLLVVPASQVGALL